jgi:hypothetical protein
MDEQREFNRRIKSILPVLLECMHKQIEPYGKAQSKKDPVDRTGNGSWKIQQLNCAVAEGEPTESATIIQAIQGYWRNPGFTGVWEEKTEVNCKGREYNTQCL